MCATPPGVCKPPIAPPEGQRRSLPPQNPTNARAPFVPPHPPRRRVTRPDERAPHPPSPTRPNVRHTLHLHRVRSLDQFRYNFNVRQQTYPTPSSLVKSRVMSKAMLTI
eukprot:829100-Pyramimonas_sp.AAC.1